MKFQLLTESKQDRINFENKFGKELSDRFFDLKQRLSSPENDMYYWMKKDASELEARLDSIEKSRKEKDEEAREGVDVIFEDDTWLVLKINTHEASMKYGKGTKWCISGKGEWESRTSKYANSKEVWDDYTNTYQGQIWFFINKKDGHKYCVVKLKFRGQESVEIYSDTGKMIIEVPNAPRVSVPTYSAVTEQVYGMLDDYIDTNNITNITVYDVSADMSHQDMAVKLEDGTTHYFRFTMRGMEEISEDEVDC